MCVCWGGGGGGAVGGQVDFFLFVRPWGGGVTSYMA